MANELPVLREVLQEALLSRGTLYRRLQEGRLHGIQLDNGAWRIPRQEVVRILGGPTKRGVQ